MTATFKAYIGTDRDRLLDRIIPLTGWSHIGQLYASAELNHVEVDAYFTMGGKRIQGAIRKATFFGAWKVASFR